MLDIPNYGVGYRNLEKVSSVFTSEKIVVDNLVTLLTAEVPVYIGGVEDIRVRRVSSDFRCSENLCEAISDMFSLWNVVSEQGLTGTYDNNVGKDFYFYHQLGGLRKILIVLTSNDQKIQEMEKSVSIKSALTVEGLSN